MRINIYKKLSRQAILLLLALLFSCRQMLEVELPPHVIEYKKVFESDESATAAIAGVYRYLAGQYNNSFASGEGGSLSILAALSADELRLLDLDQDKEPFEANVIPPSSGMNLDLWTSMYKCIYESNSIIEGLSVTTGVTQSLKEQITGEALFLRAFSHFYLVNLFGDVPLITNTDYKVNAAAGRTAATAVYGQIIRDLAEARSLLATEYTGPGRLRVNKAAATALLARVYLYTGDWVKAESMATEVLENPLYKLNTEDLSGVFLRGSKEAIWQSEQEPSGSRATNEGYFLIIESASDILALTSELYDSFEPGDKRKTEWTNVYNSPAITASFAYKYKIKSKAYSAAPLEGSVVLRLAEAYLIRSEARARQGNILGANSAASDLNAIRNRAGLGNTGANSESAMMLAIEQERRAELFTEWGHRWFDLKRWKRADEVLDPVKSEWQQTDTLYPIPQTDMNKNINLKPQNSGY